MTWLVAVDIASDQAGSLDVLIVGIVARIQRGGEKGVQDAQEAFLSAHQLDEAGHVVGHVEGEIVGIPLDETLAVGLAGVGGSFPGTVPVAGPGEGAAPVEEIPVAPGPFLINACEGILSGIKGGLVYSPVVIGIFQRRGGPG